MKTKRLIQISAAFCLLSAVLLLAGCGFMGNATGVNRFEALDEEDVEFIQMDPPAEGDQIAVIVTDLGTIRIRLFPRQSEKAVNNFVKLAKEGKYKDYQVYKITTGRAFISAKKDGGGDCIYGEPFDNQYSAKLWNFPGAVATISDQPNKGDSRFYIVGHSEIKKEIFDQMKLNRFPEKVIKQYELLGGCPELDWACNIFGQVYEGLDVVDAINKVETDQQGFPKKTVKIQSVTIETYHAEEGPSASEEASK